MPETNKRSRGPRAVEAPPDAPPLTSTSELEEKIDKLAEHLGTFVDTTQAAFNNLAESVAGALTAQDERIDHIATEGYQQPAPPTAEEAAETMPVSEFVSEIGEGTIRFMSPYSNYRMIVESSATLVVNNRPVTVPQKMAEFNHGILDVDTMTEEGAAIAQFLIDRKEFNEDYYIDPTALPRMGPPLETGVRSTGGAVRAAQPSPPTVTETGELTVKL